MNTKLLWDLVCKNSEHIETINRELGSIHSSIEWIKTYISWQFWVLGIIFTAVIINIALTKRNGKINAKNK